MATPDGRSHLVFNGEIYNYRELRGRSRIARQRVFDGSDTEVLLRLVALRRPGRRWRASAGCSRSPAGTPRRVAARRARSVRHQAALRRGRPRATSRSPPRLARCARRASSAARHRRPACSRFSNGAACRRRSPGSAAWTCSTRARGGDGARWPRRTRRVRRCARPCMPPGSGARARSSVELRFRARRRGGRARQRPRAPGRRRARRRVSLRRHRLGRASSRAPSSAGAPNLQTFTVGFDDESSEDERARVGGRAVRHDAPRTARRRRPTWRAICRRCSRGSTSRRSTPSTRYYVSRAVAATGIKAVLSGAGGDELFGGYPSFRRLPRALAAKHLAGPLWPAVGLRRRRLHARTRLRARWRHFAATNGSLIEAYRVQRGFFLPDEIASLAGPALLEPGRVARRERTACSSVERALLSPAGPETAPAAVARLESRVVPGLAAAARPRCHVDGPRARSPRAVCGSRRSSNASGRGWRAIPV